ncbi:hypothetical protein GDO78_002889 [Eleutherodactylus coqui]|uniref:Thioredoxin domain-containing protein n=1 Tax=Eleutherodactylus coqui TaxID=57060 RepID=A0A8J6K025_ELECQ|nr:hypothetical protein GDO78_002889 [Eleutherodactylus coqui]
MLYNHLPLMSFSLVAGNTDVALVNFYADWCRFSQMLHPIFEEASNIIKEEYPDRNKVVFARVDCDQHCNKRTIIGFFETMESDNYRTFEKVSNILHDDCVFIAAVGEVSKPERFSGDNVIYRPLGESAPDMVYLGSLTNFDLAFAWTQDKCVPLVREITFENGEELTEEGLPFLILFHMKDDMESLEKFQREVARQLISEKGTINFLHADCDKFRHPLLHIQKTPADCPVIAIDSFRHMYVFSDYKDLAIPGKLKQFVLDLHSGKLHREFHHGPDPTDVAPGQARLHKVMVLEGDTEPVERGAPGGCKLKPPLNARSISRMGWSRRASFRMTSIVTIKKDEISALEVVQTEEF